MLVWPRCFELYYVLMIQHLLLTEYLIIILINLARKSSLAHFSNFRNMDFVANTRIHLLSQNQWNNTGVTKMRPASGLKYFSYFGVILRKTKPPTKTFLITFT